MSLFSWSGGIFGTGHVESEEEYLAHVGACLQRWFYQASIHDFVLDETRLKVAAVDYVNAASTDSDRAERIEAMRSMMRRIFMKFSGRIGDPADNAYLIDWLREAREIEDAIL